MGGNLDDFDHSLGKKKLENRERDVEDGQNVSSVTDIEVNRSFETHGLAKQDRNRKSQPCLIS